MSLPRCIICAVADKDSLYAIGGWLGHSTLNIVERFDPHLNSWCKVASTLERKMNACGVISRGKVFVFGGSTDMKVYSKLIEMYDPTLNTWTGIKSMAAPIRFLSAVSFKGNVFIISVWNQ